MFISTRFQIWNNEDRKLGARKEWDEKTEGQAKHTQGFSKALNLEQFSPHAGWDMIFWATALQRKTWWFWQQQHECVVIWLEIHRNHNGSSSVHFKSFAKAIRKKKELHFNESEGMRYSRQQ